MVAFEVCVFFMRLFCAVEGEAGIVEIGMMTVGSVVGTEADGVEEIGGASETTGATMVPVVAEAAGKVFVAPLEAA